MADPDRKTNNSSLLKTQISDKTDDISLENEELSDAEIIELWQIANDEEWFIPVSILYL